MLDITERTHAEQIGKEADAMFAEAHCDNRHSMIDIKLYFFKILYNLLIICQ